MAIDVKQVPTAQLHTFAAQLQAPERRAQLAMVLAELALREPKNPERHAALGQVLAGIEDYVGAEVAIQKAIDLSPRKKVDATWYVLLGLCQLKKEQPTLAVQSLSLAIDGGRQDLNVQLLMSEALFTSGEEEKSLVLLRELQTKHETNGFVAYNLADKLFHFGLSKDALAYALLAKQLGSGPKRLTDWLIAQIYSALGDLKNGYMAFHTLISASFEKMSYHEQCLKFLVEVAGLSHSIQFIEGEQPKLDEVIAKYHLGHLQLMMGDTKAARHSVNQLLNLRPESLLIVELDAKVALVEGEWQHAVARYTRLWDVAASKYRSVKIPDQKGQNSVDRKKLKKIVYLPVEISGREFSSKLRVANEIAMRGHSAVLLSKISMEFRDYLPPSGLVLLKTMNRYDSRFILSQLNNYLFAALDEEALGWIGDSDVIASGVDPEILKLLDVIFANNSIHAEALKKEFPSHEAKIKVTGNPRSERVGPVEGKASERSAQRTVLICTNFAGGLSSFHDYMRVCEVTLTAANRSLEVPDGQKILAWGKDALVSEARSVAAFSEFIPRIAKEFPDVKFVIRAHPVERDDIWRVKFRSIDNVLVSSENSLADWFGSISAMVYFSGCMTGFEAYLADVPAVRFEVDPSLRVPHSCVSSKINVSASTADELIAQLKKIFAGDDQIRQRREADASIVREQFVEGDVHPSRSIAIESTQFLEKRGATDVGSNDLQQIKKFASRTSRNVTRKAISKAAVGQKRIQPSVEQIQGLLDDMARASGNQVGAKCEVLSQDVVLIRRP